MKTDWPDWDTLNWEERLEVIKKKFAEGKSTLLAKRLGIALNTLKNWKRGITVPSKAWETALRDMYERESVKNVRMASHVVFNSAVVDPIVEVVDSAISTGDIVTIQMAVYAVVAKVAAVLKATKDGNKLLIRATSIIDLPASATAEITDITENLIGYVAVVRVTQSKDLDPTFYISLELKRPGVPITRVAYKLADVALDTIIKRIISFFYGKRIKTQRAYRTCGAGKTRSSSSDV